MWSVSYYGDMISNGTNSKLAAIVVSKVLKSNENPGDENVVYFQPGGQCDINVIELWS